jgi:quercetin dioxygenase-like cupin family protein
MVFQNISDIPQREIVPGFWGRFLHSEHMTLAFWEVDPGAELPEHGHFHEQVCSVLEGEFELTVGGESRILIPGTAAVIPPDVIHSGKAITACRILDIFSPPREDYK